MLMAMTLAAFPWFIIPAVSKSYAPAIRLRWVSQTSPHYHRRRYAATVFVLVFFEELMRFLLFYTLTRAGVCSQWNFSTVPRPDLVPNYSNNACAHNWARMRSQLGVLTPSFS
jgi:hypothetical protein